MVQKNQLITLSELKSYLNWDPADSAPDDLFDAVINAASDAIENYCNTKIKSCEVSEIVSGDGSASLFLSNRNITRISSLKFWDGNAFTDYYDEAGIARYLAARSHVLYNRIDVFEEGICNFQVSYICGFDPVPADIKLVALELCTILFNNSGKGESRAGLISNQQGNFKMFFLEQLPMHGRVINKYRLVNV